MKKEFLLFPDDLKPSDIEEEIFAAKANNNNVKLFYGEYERLSLDLAVRISAGLPTSLITNSRSIVNEKVNDLANSFIIKGGYNGGIFIYHWSPTDRLVLPLIQGKILLSRGDLQWINAYPFVEHLDFAERTISLRCNVSEYEDRSDVSIFLTSRIHFGHLARDTIAGEAYLARDYLKECRKYQPNITFSFLQIQDPYLESQLRFSLNLIANGSGAALVQIPHPPIPSGSAMIIKRQLLFVKSLSAAFPCFSFQNEIGVQNQQPRRELPVAYLGIKGSPHRRILNQTEIYRFLQDRNIPSIESHYTPAQRYSLLRNARVVVAEPSSSVYNYILNSSLETLCIILLPGSFGSELTQRDCCDWHFMIKHLTSRKILPFYGDRTTIRSKPIHLTEGRLIDAPTNYNLSKLDKILQMVS